MIFVSSCSHFCDIIFIELFICIIIICIMSFRPRL
nr:MAG TPA: hypothetical protein [Caudoviricetes sp.]